MCDTCGCDDGFAAETRHPVIQLGLSITAEAEVIKAETPEGNDQE
jgi:hypothetical protein